MNIKLQLNTLILSDVIDYMVKGSLLLVVTKAKYPGMVDKLIKFDFVTKESAGDAIEVLHKMIEEPIKPNL